MNAQSLLELPLKAFYYLHSIFSNKSNDELIVKSEEDWLNEELIVEYIDKIDCNSTKSSSLHLTEGLIEEYVNKVDWNQLTPPEELSDEPLLPC